MIGSYKEVYYGKILHTTVSRLPIAQMKTLIQQSIHQVLVTLLKDQPTLLQISIQIDYSREQKHGDFSSNIALLLAKPLKCAARQVAAQIMAALNTQSNNLLFEKIEIAGPGFINFFIKPTAWYSTLSEILHQQTEYGCAQIGKAQKILVEFVSSNPTGPLHVGHGRAAAYGDVLVRLLKAVGYQVHAEYYVNDAGRQMDILSTSLWLRYLESCGETLPFPTNAYQGTYIRQIADQLKTAYAHQFHHPSPAVLQGLPPDAIIGGDKEIYIDSVIERAKILLGPDAYQQIKAFGLHHILTGIQADLREFGVQFDQWFSEQTLIADGSVERTLEALTVQGHTYESEGNLWFRATNFGDDKDRVLVRANGQPTYFAVDAAYHWQTLKARGFMQKITVLGADHHGYLARIQAVIEALGYHPAPLTMRTLQFVSLYRGDKKLSMSTRSGEFITLRELQHEVGQDAARLFFVLRKAVQPLDFDLALAKSQSHDNPVYYLQYAYARMCSILRQMIAKGFSWTQEQGLQNIANLSSIEEIALLKQLTRYPEAVLQAATQYEPALLTQYLRELAKAFHSYYNHTLLLTEETAVRDARLTLMQAIKQVLKNGFNLLGISTPDIM